MAALAAIRDGTPSSRCMLSARSEATCPGRDLPALILSAERPPIVGEVGRRPLDASSLGKEFCRGPAVGGCAWVACDAAICHDLQRCASYISADTMGLNNRSKFNVALGIEAQGFCLIK
jgi:hypothetical protein